MKALIAGDLGGRVALGAVAATFFFLSATVSPPFCTWDRFMEYSGQSSSCKLYSVAIIIVAAIAVVGFGYEFAEERICLYSLSVWASFV